MGRTWKELKIRLTAENFQHLIAIADEHAWSLSNAANYIFKVHKSQHGDKVGASIESRK